MVMGTGRRPARGPLLVGIIASALVLIVTSGCTSNDSTGVINLDALESALSPCGGTALVEAESLGARTRAQCDVAGSEIRFPDGTLLVAPAISGSAGHQGFTGTPGVARKEYYLVNLGVYGVVASETDTAGHTTWWGTAAGRQKAEKADHHDGSSR